MSKSSKPHIVIVGAGAWGASTAVSLLKSGKYDVTLLDRAPVLPAEDAASTDINKIVRFDYDQDVYAELAFKALEVWRGKEWEGMYFESGTVVTACDDEISMKSLNETIEVVTRRGPVKRLSTPAEVRHALDPKGTGVAGEMRGKKGYSNPSGGWADAAKATGYLINKTTELGGSVIPNSEVVSLIVEDGDVRGVKCQSGKEFRGDKIIIASGAWTNNIIGELLPNGLIVGCGITVAAFKLSEEEYGRYKDIPVIMGNDEIPFYSMPPTLDRMLKFGLDESGYTYKAGNPRTTFTPGINDWHAANKSSWLPKESYDRARQVVNNYFPEFKNRPFDFTRMCPIPATFDSHFVLDYTSKVSSLLVAGGGSHHSYKMMPIIGDLVMARMENTLSPELTTLWAIRSPQKVQAKSGWSTENRQNVEDIAFAKINELPVESKGIFGKAVDMLSSIVA